MWDEDDLYDYRRMDGSSSYDSGDLTEDDDSSSEGLRNRKQAALPLSLREDTLE